MQAAPLYVSARVVEDIVDGELYNHEVKIRSLHEIAMQGKGTAEHVTACYNEFLRSRDIFELTVGLNALYAANVLREQMMACQEENDRILAQRLHSKELRRAEQRQREADELRALEVARPQGPWGYPGNRRTRCGLPGCSNEAGSYGFCSSDHQERASSRMLLPPPRDDVERCFMGATGDYSCLLLTRQSQEREDVINQFLRAWKKPGEPRVQRVYQVVPSPHVKERFDRYALSVGNVRRRFHGTSIECDFGIDLGAPPCESKTCRVCNILSSGFSKRFAGNGPNISLRRLRYGNGIYFSATSGKSNDYAEGSERERRGHAWRCMLVASVAAGKVFKTIEAEILDERLLPPRGYDSVVGEVGPNLNYDELVVYNDAAALPEFLIVYILKA